MKSEIINKDGNTISYPWIAKSNELIVLFSCEKHGIVLFNGDKWDKIHCVGDWSESWDMDLFQEFKDLITLSN